MLGSGEHQYEVVTHQWGQLPSQIVWGETHGVTIDEAGLVYIKHRNDAHTRWTRSSSSIPGEVRPLVRQGISPRRARNRRPQGGNEEFLYLWTCTRHRHQSHAEGGPRVGERLPQEPGVYADKAKYSPTNVAFGADGGFTSATATDRITSTSTTKTPNGSALGAAFGERRAR